MPTGGALSDWMVGRETGGEKIMFRLLSCVCLVGCLALAACARGSDPESGVTVRTRGDAQVYGVYRSHLQPEAAR
jgi:hypothetical protein